MKANENSLFSNDDEAYIRPKIGRLSDNFVDQSSNDEIKLNENCKDKFEQREKPDENGLGFEIKDDDLGSKTIGMLPLLNLRYKLCV